MHFLQKFYKKTLKYDIANVFNYSANSSSNLLKIKKIILNFNFETNNIKKNFSSFLIFELITKQQSELIDIKKTNILLKIRKGVVIGCKLTIKNKNLFLLLSKIILEIFPNFKLNYIFESNVFACQLWVLYFTELKKFYTYFFSISKLHVFIVTNSSNKKQLIFFFKSLQFSFQKIT